MYYPKSYITPNLYSNGELGYKDSNQPYTGYYFSTIDGRQFTSKFPGDGKNLELSPITFQGFDNLETLEDSTPLDSRFFYGNKSYSILKKVKYRKNLTNLPSQYFPSPSEDDYTIGEFTRFFSKKVNENIYYETQRLFTNSLYLGFSLPWLISGEENKVRLTNERIVKLREQELGISGLGLYLKFDYLKFYK